jgi:hypothetical protein
VSETMKHWRLPASMKRAAARGVRPDHQNIKKDSAAICQAESSRRGIFAVAGESAAVDFAGDVASILR